ncbi:MAG: hypothetical protein ACU83N_11000 [Gammaproteobacteria bacterium]
MEGGIRYQETRFAQEALCSLALLAAVLALGLEITASKQAGLACQAPGNLRAQTVDPRLQGIIEQVAEHQHAALHPSAAAGKFGWVNCFITITL